MIRKRADGTIARGRDPGCARNALEGSLTSSVCAPNISVRLARWLLMVHDRMPSAELPLTHEFLSLMLAVRRPGVTEAITQFERTGSKMPRCSFEHPVCRTQLMRLADTYELLANTCDETFHLSPPWLTIA